MKFRPSPILFALILPLLLGFGMNGDYLILIQVDEKPDFTLLRDLEIKPHFKGEGWVLATSPTYEIDRIESYGFHVRVIDKTPWSESYYLAGRFDPGPLTGIPFSFHELARVPEGVIVKGNDKDVVELIESGLQPVRIHDFEIPLSEKRGRALGALPEVRSGPERRVVSQVSDSTITDFITRLVAFRTRYAYSESTYAATQYIHDQFVEFGYTNVYLDSLFFPGPVQRNVVAEKPGTLDPERVIVVGGHHDSISNDPGCHPDTLAPGADDDGSGTAVTMELARVLADVDTDISIIFVAFAAEEFGLWGSYHFAEEAYNQGMDIVVMLNLDMVSNELDDDWNIRLNVENPSNPFAQIIAVMASTYTDITTQYWMPVNTQSDHYPFYLLGYDCVFVIESDYSQNRHRCTDTIENINIPYCTDVAEMMAATIVYIANTPQTPMGFNVANVGDGCSILISWEPNTEADLAGYNIYYGSQSGEYDSLRVVDPSLTSCTLQDFDEGDSLYIAMSAFDGDGNESFLTEEAAILVSSIPSAPTGLVSTSLEESISLTWNPNQGELDIAGYNVYRSTGGGDPSHQGFVADPGTSFVDSAVEPHTLYMYCVSAVDNQVPSNESDLSEETYGQLATHDIGILVVDNTPDGTGSPLNPTDEEVDDFYSDILGNYNVQASWDVSDSAVVSRRIMDYDIGIYSAVVWHNDVRTSPVIAPDTVTMRKFLDTGGNLWISGWMLMSTITGENGPEYTFEEGEFIHDYFGTDSAETSPSNSFDFIGANSLAGNFPSLSVDTEKSPFHALFSMDVIYPPFSGTTPIYSYVSSDSATSEFHGHPVGLMSSSQDFGLIVTDFPIFFMEIEDARLLAAEVMNQFAEPVGVEVEGVVALPRSYRLFQNYPNPFNPMTTITFEIPGMGWSAEEAAKIPTSLGIYDIRGRLVRVLLEEALSPGRYQITWDGKYANEKSVSSGIYFYRLKSGSFDSTRKMILTK